jgi:hypothetical protein
MEQFDLENRARTTLAQILGGIVLLAGGFATWRNLVLAQQGQITDRFTKAIEQLGAVYPDGKAKLDVRPGGQVALADWRQFLAQLDAIRLKHKMTIVVLSHARVSTFKNPEGPDYDRFQPDVTPKTWSLTHKWADAVLFWNFEVQVAQVQENRKAQTKKGKLIGQNRILYTQNAGAYDAKNRLGLPLEIDMGNSPQEAWLALKTAIIAARKHPQSQSQPEPQPTPGGVQ